MKRLLAFSLIGSSLLFGPHSAKADYDFFGIKVNPILDSNGVGNSDRDTVGTYIYTIDSSTGQETYRTHFCTDLRPDADPGEWMCSNGSNHYVDSKSGNLIVETESNTYKIYNVENNTFESSSSLTNWKASFSNTYEKPSIRKDSSGNKVLEIFGSKLVERRANGAIQIGGDTDDIDIVSDGLNIDGAAVITKNADGSIQIGADGNDIDITSEGLTVDGVSLITKKDSGEIHIGKNSLITKEEDGVQKLYAKDENDNAIDINVTNGSKLLIDGVEVTAGGSNAQVTTNQNNISTNTSNISTNKANIKNLGEGVAGSTALTAALSALPQTSKDSKLSCGVGTGAYSSRYAVGFGCASKVNERIDINTGGSYVFGGSKSYGGGTLDSGVVKAGFVFKLGELKKTTQISMKEKEKMEEKIYSLEVKNEKIISQNKNLATKNQSIIDQNKALLSRLERLEKIALIGIKSKDLAVYKLK